MLYKIKLKGKDTVIVDNGRDKQYSILLCGKIYLRIGCVDSIIEFQNY